MPQTTINTYLLHVIKKFNKVWGRIFKKEKKEEEGGDEREEKDDDTVVGPRFFTGNNP